MCIILYNDIFIISNRIMIFEHWKQPTLVTLPSIEFLCWFRFRSIAISQFPKLGTNGSLQNPVVLPPNEFVVFLGGCDKNWAVVSNIFIFIPTWGNDPI